MEDKIHAENEDDIANIYSNLDTINIADEYEKAISLNEQLKARIDKLEKDITVIMNELNQAKADQAQLQLNISHLFNTAKGEIGRKDRIIQELRMELDNIKFRRNTNNQIHNRNGNKYGMNNSQNQSSKRNWNDTSDQNINNKRERSRSPSYNRSRSPTRIKYKYPYNTERVDKPLDKKSRSRSKSPSYKKARINADKYEVNRNNSDSVYTNTKNSRQEKSHTSKGHNIEDKHISKGNSTENKHTNKGRNTEVKNIAKQRSTEVKYDNSNEVGMKEPSRLKVTSANLKSTTRSKETNKDSLKSTKDDIKIPPELSVAHDKKNLKIDTNYKPTDKNVSTEMTVAFKNSKTSSAKIEENINCPLPNKTEATTFLTEVDEHYKKQMLTDSKESLPSSNVSETPKNELQPLTIKETESKVNSNKTPDSSLTIVSKEPDKSHPRTESKADVIAKPNKTNDKSLSIVSKEPDKSYPRLDIKQNEENTNNDSINSSQSILSGKSENKNGTENKLKEQDNNSSIVKRRRVRATVKFIN